MNLQLCKYLISVNTELVNKTAVGNCHCIGLNSFIINEKPKIRLFIAEPNCELFNKFDHLNPIIPIHPHKYDDLFTQLEGDMIHHIYKVDPNGDTFNKYKYRRLADDKTNIELIGTEKLICHAIGKNIKELKSTELHTASLQGNRCSWLITETFENKNFEQFSYHQNLIPRNELYTKIENANEYLNEYFSI